VFLLFLLGVWGGMLLVDLRGECFASGMSAMRIAHGDDFGPTFIFGLGALVLRRSMSRGRESFFGRNWDAPLLHIAYL